MLFVPLDLNAYAFTAGIILGVTYVVHRENNKRPANTKVAPTATSYKKGYLLEKDFVSAIFNGF